MCGLVGIYSSNMLMKHKDAFADLLYLDTWRGRDSTGVAAIRHNADTAILKSTVPGYEFVEGPKLDQHLKLNDFCWIGHNRFGTVGKNIKTNAHPFQILDEDGSCLVVGAHNGTLKNKYDLTDHQKFGTDSEALFNEIALVGIEKALEKVEGAWALTYYEHDLEELHIIRNKERPLFYAWEKGRKSLIWASEMWMIRVACSRHKIELEEDKVFSFVEDCLYKFPAPMKANEELTLERKAGLVGKAPHFFQGGLWENGVWIGGRRRAQPETKTQTPPQNQSNVPITGNYSRSGTPSGTPEQNNGETLLQKNGKPSESVSDNVTNIDRAKKFKGYAGVPLTKRELEDQLANGCGWCEQEFIGEKDKYGWLAPGKAVCSKCLDGEHQESKQTNVNKSVH